VLDGGDEDRGKGLGRDGRRLIAEAAKRTGVPLLLEPRFERQVAARMKTYTDHAGGAPIKLYVNVGGGIGSLGARINGHLMEPGLNTSVTGKRSARDGVMTLMARKGIAVIHINYIERLCKRYGFPPDPLAYPAPGTGPMFERKVHSLNLVGSLLIGLLITFFVTIRLDVRHYLRHRQVSDLV